METILAICEPCENGYSVKSPIVGAYHCPPQKGSLVNNQNSCGYMVALGEKYELKLPKNIQGKIEEITDNLEDIGYQTELFQLQTLETTGNNSVENEGNQETLKHENAIVAPTDGMFYRRPSPNEPFYVEVGSVVKKGQVLGLVEVMKTFNQILYLGDNLPETATIREICMHDGAEVKSQQLLFLIDTVS